MGWRIQKGDGRSAWCNTGDCCMGSFYGSAQHVLGIGVVCVGYWSFEFAWNILPASIDESSSLTFSQNIWESIFTYLFIYSGCFYSTSSSQLLLLTSTQRRFIHSTNTVSEIHAKVPHATAGEGLALGPYVAARAGFKPTTFQMKGVESTNEPSHPTFTIRLHM